MCISQGAGDISCLLRLLCKVRHLLIKTVFNGYSFIIVLGGQGKLEGSRLLVGEMAFWWIFLV